MKNLFWKIGNIYAVLLGWPLLYRFHQALINLSLHAVGYNNFYITKATGEQWFIKKIIKKNQPKVIIDVGANVGNYTKALLSETTAHIYAIEPNPGCVDSLNKLGERVTVVNAAVADYDGEATINFRDSHDERASLDKNIRSGQEVLVMVKRLETIIREHSLSEIDFIKIDTEGFELEVLKGLGNIRPKLIQFEFNIHHLYRAVSLHQITSLLQDYDFYRLLPHGWIKIDPKKYLSNIYMICNVVAVKK